MEPATYSSRRWTTRCLIAAIAFVAIGIIVLLTNTVWGAVIAIVEYLVALFFMFSAPNRVTIDAETVTVRNGMRVRRVRRSDITGIAFAPIGWFSPRCAALQVGDQQVKMFTAFREWIHPDQVSPVGAQIAMALGFTPAGEAADSASDSAS